MFILDVFASWPKLLYRKVTFSPLLCIIAALWLYFCDLAELPVDEGNLRQDCRLVDLNVHYWLHNTTRCLIQFGDDKAVVAQCSIGF